mgnify:CR=1 FL=1
MNNLYDLDNIFAKILRSEIPCNKILENEFALAFSVIPNWLFVEAVMASRDHGITHSADSKPKADDSQMALALA